jgi:hypothetical protein
MIRGNQRRSRQKRRADKGCVNQEVRRGMLFHQLVFLCGRSAIISSCADFHPYLLAFLSLRFVG